MCKQVIFYQGDEGQTQLFPSMPIGLIGCTAILVHRFRHYRRHNRQITAAICQRTPHCAASFFPVLFIQLPSLDIAARSPAVSLHALLTSDPLT